MKFTIEEVPVSKKNSMRLVNVRGRMVPIPSAAYKKFEAACEKYLQPVEDSIDSPVNVECVFYMPTHRPVDISNLISAIDDILVKYNILKDDNRNIVAGHDGSRVYYDKERPRVEISITEMLDYESWKKEDNKQVKKHAKK